MKQDEKIFSPLTSPSKALLKVADCVSKTNKLPVLDLGCGFGRNAVMLALRGMSVVCVDSDLSRLQTLNTLAPEYVSQTKLKGVLPGKLHPVCSNIQKADWLFPSECFSAAILVHFLTLDLIPAIESSLVEGGHLFIETFGNQGQNFLDLPRAGELAELLKPRFKILNYQEKPAGPVGHDAVSVKLFAQKCSAILPA